MISLECVRALFFDSAFHCEVLFLDKLSFWTEWLPTCGAAFFPRMNPVEKNEQLYPGILSTRVERHSDVTFLGLMHPLPPVNYYPGWGGSGYHTLASRGPHVVLRAREWESSPQDLHWLRGKGGFPKRYRSKLLEVRWIDVQEGQLPISSAPWPSKMVGKECKVFQTHVPMEFPSPCLPEFCKIQFGKS